MSRPLKAADDRRSEIVRFTVRPAEYVRIRQAAAESGQSISAYARSLVIDGRVVIEKTRKLDHEAFDELRRIGVNLNQAVHRFHASGEAPASLERAAAALEDFLASNLGDGPKGGG